MQCYTVTRTSTLHKGTTFMLHSTYETQFTNITLNSPYKAGRSCHITVRVIGILSYNCDELDNEGNMWFQQLDIWTGCVSIAFQALHNTSICLQYALTQFVQVVNHVVVSLLTQSIISIHTHTHTQTKSTEYIVCTLGDTELIGFPTW